MSGSRNSICSRKLSGTTVKSKIYANRTWVKSKTYLKKFLTKNVATKIHEDNSRLILSGQFANDKLNLILKQFAEIYILCPLCHKPDTRIEQGKKKLTLICGAEGSRHVLPALN